MDKSLIVDGRQVRALRAILGMTQAELAGAVSVNRNSINHAEQQKRLSPRSLVAAVVAKYGAENGVIANVVDGSPYVRFEGGGPNGG